MKKYTIQFSAAPEDIKLAQEFRGKLFRNGQVDADELDEKAVHGVIRNQYGFIVCVFRMLPIENGDFEASYSAKHYDLRSLKQFNGKSLELGRFCVHPDYNDPDIIRLAWSALTKYVIDQNIELLFGCSSFHGADADIHAEAFTLLKERHLAPRQFMPRVKAPKVFNFASNFRLRRPNIQLAQKTMPPLLRSYLLMGGWVSDHAVVDNDLNTVHVFTGVEINKIPPARKKLFLGLGALFRQK